MSDHPYRIIQIVAAQPGLVAQYEHRSKETGKIDDRWTERIDVIALVELFGHPDYTDGTQQLRALEIDAAANSDLNMWTDHTDHDAHGFGITEPDPQEDT